MHRAAARAPRPARGPALGLLAVIAAAAVLVDLSGARVAVAAAPVDAPFPRSAETAAGSVGIRLVDVPAATADDPRTRDYVVDHLQPGITIDRRVEVSNTTGDDLEVELYAGAAVIEDDTFRGLPGDEENTLTSWTSMGPGSVTVPPGGAVRTTVSIAVPDDAAPGEHYAVIWAEVSGTSAGSVAMTARTGIRVYLSVGGDNAPASDFRISSVTAERGADGRATVSAAVENSGGRALDLAGTLTLTAVTGALSAGPYPASVGTTIAPGTSGAVAVPITDDVAAGPWTATLELHSGLVSRTETVEITFPEAGAAAPVPVVPDRTPWIVAGAIAAVAALAGWLLLRRRRRRRSMRVDA